MFEDRNEAASLLAKELQEYKGKDGVILAIPRGGVPVGYVIAKELSLPLEVILSKKIGHPANPEFAIGSVSLQGTIINPGHSDVSPDYIRKEAGRILKEIKSKAKRYMGNQKPIDLKGKYVIIVDDGIATGTTILASVKAIRNKNAREIIVAVPVVPYDSISKISREVDQFVYLLSPEYFVGVGGFYRNFDQVSDDEVIQLLKNANPAIDR